MNEREKCMNFCKNPDFTLPTSIGGFWGPLCLVQEMERIARESEAQMVAQETDWIQTRMVAQETRRQTHLNQSVAEILANSTRGAQQTRVQMRYFKS
jgi:hypothetical protein